MENRPTKEIALFDICDTLYDSNTTFDFLSWYFREDRKYTRFIRRAKSRIPRLANAVNFRVFHQDIIRLRAIRFLTGESRTELKNAAREFYSLYLEPRKRTAVLELLEGFKARRTDICLVSGTLDFLAEMIGEQLGVGTIFSTRLIYKDGICSGRILEDWLGRKDKLLAREGVFLDNVTVITDNLSDRPLVKRAKKAFIITKAKNNKSWDSLRNIEKFFVVE